MMQKIFLAGVVLVIRAIAFVLGKVLFRLRVQGMENLPKDRGAILVINHGSYLDFLIAACILPGKFSFVMNAHVYKKKSLNWIFKAIHCIPVGSGLDLSARKQFNEDVQRQVNNGMFVCLFAEGTVTRTGQILEFKKGIEHLAAGSDAPIIPVHFDNVVGAPFSWMPGSGRLVKFKIKGLRRRVHVAIGKELQRPVSAFQLRQKVKELESQNFKRRFQPTDELTAAISRKISREPKGRWMSNENVFSYSSILQHISTLSQILSDEIKGDQTIAVLLPGGIDAMQMNLFLMFNKKTVVNIDPGFTNEQRLFVCNTSGVRTLITTRDLSFTRFSPVTERVIYIEDVQDAIEAGVPVKSCLSSLSSAGRQFRNWFKSSSELDRVVAIFYDKRKDEEIRGLALTNLNLMAVLAGIRQSHFFDSSVCIQANLPLYHSFGFVLQLLMPLYFDVSWSQYAQVNSSRRLILLTPSQLSDRIAVDAMKDGDSVFTSGVLPNDEAVLELKQRGITVYTCGGMNETSSIFSINLENFKGIDIEGKTLEHEAGEDGTIGKAIPGVAVKVCSDDMGMNECAPDEIGRIWLSGAAIASDYITAADANPPRFVNGWLDTGIRGYINSKGFIRYQVEIGTPMQPTHSLV
jgi:acyl-[acyl-carrier-protein]-phospholipid O-acyltransferase/long-chain-fatty-acid--[acyl-carrier-protein] ligase